MNIYLELFNDVISSVARVLAGVTLGFIIGFILALFRFSLPQYLQKNFLIKFIFEAPKYPPPIAWIPFVILLFGIGSFSSVVLVILGSFPPIFTQIYESLKRADSRYSLLANNFEINGFRRQMDILVPSIYREIFVGLKIGTGMGWMSIIASEMVSGQSGLGYSIQAHRLNLNYEMMIVYIFVIGLIGYLLQILISLIEAKIVKWPPS